MQNIILSSIIINNTKTKITMQKKFNLMYLYTQKNRETLSLIIT